ncbi:hypothetical protein Pint_26499 [Pistacia integerrima]|uniref:Uncharacterized protein n=1 Tax=Pistacia integerrima TaxID=434235 RepID=A0ACC0YFS2_9ROSI|nr:hypothetical protein Pint_26499 [Pistacia integerrima]
MAGRLFRCLACKLSLSSAIFVGVKRVAEAGDSSLGSCLYRFLVNRPSLYPIFKPVLQ